MALMEKVAAARQSHFDQSKQAMLSQLLQKMKSGASESQSSQNIF